MSSAHSGSIATRRRYAHAQIARWLESLIDREAIIDDRRNEFARALEALIEAMRERDRTARRLTQLLEHYERGCATSRVHEPNDSSRP